MDVNLRYRSMSIISASKSHIQVVAGILYDYIGNVLIARRIDHRYYGLWEFPGGKIHEGETIATAIQREFYEEFGVYVEPLHHCLTTSFYSPPINQNLEISFIQIRYQTGNWTLKVHDAIGWIAISNLKKYPLLPADEAALPQLFPNIYRLI